MRYMNFVYKNKSIKISIFLFKLLKPLKNHI